MLLVAGCGGNSGQPAPRANASPSSPAPQSPNADPEPFGALSAAEYAAIVREYRELRPLVQGANGTSAMQAARDACARLRTPRTQLVTRVRTDCNNAISFFSAFDDLEQVGSACTTLPEGQRIACVRDRYAAMADAIRATRNGAAAINRELERRGITGLCATSIGIKPDQLAAYSRAERAARAGVDAIAAGDAAALDRATKALESALTTGANDDPLAGIEHGCKKAPRRRLPRVPSGGGVSA